MNQQPIIDREPTAERRPTWVRPVIIWVIYPLMLPLLFFALAIWEPSSSIFMNLWVLGGIALCAIIGLAIYDLRRPQRSEVATLTLRFQQEAQFRLQFFAFMERVGFHAELTPEGHYRFEPVAGKGYIHIGPFTIPPKRSIWLSMELASDHAVLSGPKSTLTIVQRMLVHHLQQAQHQEMTLPY